MTLNIARDTMFGSHRMEPRLSLLQRVPLPLVVIARILTTLNNKTTADLLPISDLARHDFIGGGGTVALVVRVSL